MHLPTSQFYILCIVIAIRFVEIKSALIAKNTTDILLTEHESKQIAKLKDVAKNILDVPYMRSNKYLINWIRDSPTDLNVAYQKLLKYWNYRKENGFDTIQNEDWSVWSKNYPYTIFGKDFNGCTVAGLYVGSWETRKALIANPKEFYRYLDWASENVYKAIYDSSCLNGTFILNLNGYSVREHGCLQCISTYVHLIGNLDTHYPRVVNKLICINTPRIFKQLLRVLIPFLSPYTASTIETYGHDGSEWGPIIRSKISPEILPLEFGGTKKKKVLSDQRK